MAPCLIGTEIIRCLKVTGAMGTCLFTCVVFVHHFPVHVLDDINRSIFLDNVNG